MKRARYELRFKTKDEAKIQQILEEADTFFIELEHRHPELTVST